MSLLLLDRRLTKTQIPGIESVHELHVWRLDQKKAIATAHVMVSDPEQSVSSFMEQAKTISECLHAYGIHSATIQPELAGKSSETGTPEVVISSTASATSTAVRHRRRPETTLAACQMLCGKGICENLMCCVVKL